MSKEWKPRIVAFFCNWCTYTAADLAGVSRMKYASNTRTIRLMCSGRVDPQFILDALARGADGVPATGSVAPVAFRRGRKARSLPRPSESPSRAPPVAHELGSMSTVVRRWLVSSVRATKEELRW